MNLVPRIAALLGASLAILLDVDIVVGLHGVDGVVGELDPTQGSASHVR